MTSNDASRLAALLERIGRLLSTEAQAGGLLPVQWEALRYLERANRFSMTAAALTAYLGLTKGTVSQTLNALEAKGLITKRVDRRDRRSKQLALSAKGRAMLKRDPLTETTGVIDKLDRASREQLSTALESFLSARLETQGRQPFGQCEDCRYFARHHPDGAPHYCQLLEERLGEGDAQAICFEQRPAQVE